MGKGSWPPKKPEQEARRTFFASSLPCRGQQFGSDSLGTVQGQHGTHPSLHDPGHRNGGLTVPTFQPPGALGNQKISGSSLHGSFRPNLRGVGETPLSSEMEEDLFSEPGLAPNKDAALLWDGGKRTIAIDRPSPMRVSFSTSVFKTSRGQMRHEPIQMRHATEHIHSSSSMVAKEKQYHAINPMRAIRAIADASIEEVRAAIYEASLDPDRQLLPLTLKTIADRVHVMGPDGFALGHAVRDVQSVLCRGHGADGS